MDVFKRPRQAILDCPPFDETVLVFVDDFGDDFLQPVSQDLCDDFQTTIQ